MASQMPPTGQICWFEIPVTDVSRASAFYSGVLGWSCNPEGMPSPMPGTKSVHMFQKGTLHGAFLLVPDTSSIASVTDSAKPEKSSTITTFCVDDLEDSIEKVKETGGKIHVPKTAIGGDMGYFSRVIDTEGNLIGLWCNK